MKDTKGLLDLTRAVVEAYVANNPVHSRDLPNLIRSVHGVLQELGAGPPAAPEPAVPVHASVTPDYLICLEDGKELKTLRRYLQTHFGLSPDDYRRKWGLSADYPMTAPNYTKQRSQLAKQFGLGSGRPRKARRRKYGIAA